MFSFFFIFSLFLAASHNPYLQILPYTRLFQIFAVSPLVQGTPAVRQLFFGCTPDDTEFT